MVLSIKHICFFLTLPSLKNIQCHQTLVCPECVSLTTAEMKKNPGHIIYGLIYNINILLPPTVQIADHQIVSLQEKFPNGPIS